MNVLVAVLRIPGQVLGFVVDRFSPGYPAFLSNEEIDERIRERPRPPRPPVRPE